MSKFREKAQGITKETIGQMIGDDALVQQGRKQQQKADRPTEADGSTDGSDRRSERRQSRE